MWDKLWQLASANNRPYNIYIAANPIYGAGEIRLNSIFTVDCQSTLTGIKYGCTKTLLLTTRVLGFLSSHILLGKLQLNFVKCHFPCGVSSVIFTAKEVQISKVGILTIHFLQGLCYLSVWHLLCGNVCYWIIALEIIGTL